MAKEHQNVTYSKYYIFRHKGNNGKSEDIEFRTSTDDWVSDFNHARLFLTYDGVIDYAEALKQCFSDWNICVGQVHVVTNPHFPIELIGDDVLSKDNGE